MINPTSAVPLYVQVADDLRRRIEMGEFSESGVLPSENGFCEEYEVSRATIRKAIQTLVDDDVLDTRHGKGTFIRQPKIVSSLSTFKGFTYFCHENNIETSSRVLALQEVEPSVAVRRHLRMEENESAVYLKRVRSINHINAMIEHIYLPVKNFGFLLGVDMENASLYETIERETGLRLEDNCFPSIVLEAGLATDEEKRILNIAGEAAMFILSETVYMSTGKPVHSTKQVMLGDYFKYFFSIKANQLGINWQGLEAVECRKQ